jgi:hypothetical protein
MKPFLFFAVFLCLFTRTEQAAFAQEESAFLVRGNFWVTGFPGIEENAFSCFSGEYSLSGGGGFSVSLCRDLIPFSARDWQSRPGAEYRAIQRIRGDTLYVCLPPEGNGSGWNVMFQFPMPAPDDGAVDRLTAVWMRRFLYFFSLIKNISDISLPAVVTY